MDLSIKWLEESLEMQINSGRKLSGRSGSILTFLDFVKITNRIECLNMQSYIDYKKDF